MPANDPPPTLEYRPGADDAPTDWRGGFSLFGLIVENILGILIGLCGLIFAASDLYVIATVITSLVRPFDWIVVIAGTVGVGLLTMTACALLFLASQFIGTRPRP